MVTKILVRLGLPILASGALAAEPVATPDLSDARVTLPYAELKTLWQNAQRETQEKRKPPVEAALLSARYQVVLKGDVAAAVVEYEIENFTDEWTTVPLLGAQTQVDDIEPADAQLIVRDGHYALLTNRPGKQKVRVKFAAKLSSGTDGNRFALAASPAVINSLSVAGLPEKQTLRVADATLLSSEKDRSTFRLPAAERIEFDVVPETAAEPPAPNLPVVETVQAVVETATAKTRIVSDGASLTEIDYSIRHERALPWKVDLPEGSELLAATVDGQAVNPIDRGERVLEFALPSGKKLSAVSISYTAKKPAFKPVSGQIAVELPQTELLMHWLDWELRIPVAYEIAAFEGNVESAPCDKTDPTSRVIPLHKELCKNERPRAEFFYQKPQPNK
ncbi:MAG TPA: hypothetical protein VGW57_00740 [Chthoniobacterales bacterium]|nr:hypothetical protein [Chthoniobacterales bacterium]